MWLETGQKNLKYLLYNTSERKLMPGLGCIQEGTSRVPFDVGILAFLSPGFKSQALAHS